MSGLSTLDLSKVLTDSPMTRRFFLGVYPADIFPIQSLLPNCCIWNTADSRSKGEHWVACFMDEFKTAFYFDTGGSPIPPLFLGHLRHFRVIRLLKKPVQSPFSDLCGQYCMLFLHWVCSGRKPYSFIKKGFSSNLLKNDEYVDKWYNALLHSLRRNK